MVLLRPRTSSHRRLTVIWLQRTIIQEALNWGVPLIFYWAVYDNTGSGYWLVYPDHRRNLPKVRRFRDWLLAEISRDKAMLAASV